MKVYELVFSPTGGTRKVSGVFSSAFEKNVTVIDLCSKELEFCNIQLASEDVCVISVPSFGGRVPSIAAERIAQVKANGAKAVLVCVYGNRHYDDTLLELKDIAEGAGFKSVAAVAAIAEHSIMHQFAAGRPNADDMAVLGDFAAKVVDAVKNYSGAELNVPGNRPYKPTGPLPLKAKVDESCGGCGVCVAACPVGAIPEDDPASTDAEKCITCMACISACPNGARFVDAGIVAAFSEKLAPVCSVAKDNELFL